MVALGLEPVIRGGGETGGGSCSSQADSVAVTRYKHQDISLCTGDGGQMKTLQRILSACISGLTLFLVSCSTFPVGDPDQISLKGRVFVEWYREDRFVYRQTNNPLSFKPSFLDIPIVPEDMFTDGGSVPRVFWNIPGLSPWALGPAYIIHDWVFEVHRCNRDAPPEIKNITFQQSAQILAEVGQSLVDAGLIDNNQLPAIVWAVRTRYARDIWDRPATEEECEPPPSQFATRALRLRGEIRKVVDFEIPAPNR